ncbi:RNA-directed DNA polymerase, eukaryota [Tanacetum coccineum]
MYRGLRQGDPLFPLLFILAMEGLHLSIQKAMEDKRILRVFVGVEKFNISHLFYANDVVFLSEWNVKKVDVGVDMEDVSNMARASGCAAGSCPFSYLGVNIGANMACRSNWDNDKTLASMDRGGLGIGSLASLNLALLQKWRWRFYNEKEALWCHVIKAIHGEDGGISKQEDQRIKKGAGRNDQICWSLDGQTEFMVAGIRRHIDAFLHTGRDMCTLWCNSVPKKVNVFAWRVMLDRLPTRYNLSRIGLEIDSILCPTCGAGMETMSHVLVACSLAKRFGFKFLDGVIYPCSVVSRFPIGGNGVSRFLLEITGDQKYT